MTAARFAFYVALCSAIILALLFVKPLTVLAALVFVGAGVARLAGRL